MAEAESGALAGDGGAALEIVRFASGPWRVGIEARHVRGARLAAPGARALDMAPPPVGALVPAAPLQCLSIALPQGLAELTVRGPVELARVPVACIHPLPAVLAARCALPGLRALALGEGDAQPTLLCDAQALAGAFANS